MTTEEKLKRIEATHENVPVLAEQVLLLHEDGRVTEAGTYTPAGMTCKACGGPYPCDVVKLARALDEAQKAIHGLLGDEWRVTADWGDRDEREVIKERAGAAEGKAERTLEEVAGVVRPTTRLAAEERRRVLLTDWTEAKEMKQHFVTFYSPGTLVCEETTQPIPSWDVEKAKGMARDIKERYGATPFGFRFSTRERGPKDLDSKLTETGPMYFLGGKVETLAQVKKRATEKDRVLVANMECNGIKRIITNNNSWQHTTELRDTDVVLSWP